MKKAFCDRCTEPAESQPFVQVTETIPATKAGGTTSIEAWVSFAGKSENGAKRDLDLCLSCIALFCSALANRARANEKPPNSGQDATNDPDYSL